MKAQTKLFCASLAFVGVALMPNIVNASDGSIASGGSTVPDSSSGSVDKAGDHKHTFANHAEANAGAVREARAARVRPISGNGINYHNGPVMLGGLAARATEAPVRVPSSARMTRIDRRGRRRTAPNVVRREAILTGSALTRAGGWYRKPPENHRAWLAESGASG